jgi:hypothetical protein
MKLTVLKEKRFRVAAIGIGDDSAVLTFLKEAVPDMQGSAAGMWALFDRYADDGRKRLTTAVFHEANKQEEIWEFIKGRLRLFCFLDEGALVILTHGAVKKTQKADKSEVREAVHMKRAYFEAKQNHQLQWFHLGSEGI